MKIKGFTLIELLIVVAIIGILAAIAIPNFLSAQTRAKVATANAEMRNLAVALESYYIDHNQYPLPDISGWVDATDNGNGAFGGFTPIAITSPVVYVSSLPDDPFNLGDTIPTDPASFAYRYATSPLTCWILLSNGPDTATDDVNETEFVDLSTNRCDPNLAFSHFNGTGVIYDPSNGTTSEGDITRNGP